MHIFEGPELLATEKKELYIDSIVALLTFSLF